MYIRCLDGIPECVVAQIHEAAEELIREKGATSAMAAALAYIAGAKDIMSSSLLSAHQVHCLCYGSCISEFCSREGVHVYSTESWRGAKYKNKSNYFGELRGKPVCRRIDLGKPINNK